MYAMSKSSKLSSISSFSGTSSVDDDLDELFKQAEELLGREVSPQVVRAFRKASISLGSMDKTASNLEGANDSNREDAGQRDIVFHAPELSNVSANMAPDELSTRRESYVGSIDETIPIKSDAKTQVSDESRDSVLSEAERVNGHALSDDVVEAWRKTKVDTTETDTSTRNPNEPSPATSIRPDVQSTVSDLTFSPNRTNITISQSESTQKNDIQVPYHDKDPIDEESEQLGLSASDDIDSILRER